MTPVPCRETIGYVDPEPETPAADRLHHIGFDDGWAAIDGYVARSWIIVLVDRVRSIFHAPATPRAEKGKLGKSPY